MSQKKNNLHNPGVPYRYAGHRTILFDEASRHEKAEKIFLLLKEYYKGSLEKAVALDIGCSAGLIASWLSDRMKKVFGIDIDNDTIAVLRKVEKKHPRFKFVFASGDDLPFPDASFDVIIANIMYYLLPYDRQKKMFDEIRRCLRPDGLCYFAAPNRFLVLDGKFKLPFLCWMPLWMGRLYVRLLSPLKEYNEYYRTLFGLRRLAGKNFFVNDVSLRIIDHPDRYKMHVPGGSLGGLLIRVFARIFYIFLPNFVFILKPKERT